jgi:DNA-binding response OmpR family regulator
MLPIMDSYLVARRLRGKPHSDPHLELTARDSVPDIVRGLECGADDYLTKPFSFFKLVARLGALARRAV